MRGGTHFICSILDGLSDFRVEAVSLVNSSGGFLEHAESFNERIRHAGLVASDVKVLQGALRLAAVVAVCRDLHVAHRVFFCSEAAHSLCKDFR